MIIFIIIFNYVACRLPHFTVLCVVLSSLLEISSTFCREDGLKFWEKTTKRKEEKHGTGSDLMFYLAWLCRGSCLFNSLSVPWSSRSHWRSRGALCIFSASVSVAASVPRADFPTDSFLSLASVPRLFEASVRFPPAPVFFLRNLLSHLR